MESCVALLTILKDHQTTSIEHCVGQVYKFDRSWESVYNIA